MAGKILEMKILVLFNVIDQTILAKRGDTLKPSQKPKPDQTQPFQHFFHEGLELEI